MTIRNSRPYIAPEGMGGNRVTHLRVVRAGVTKITWCVELESGGWLAAHLLKCSSTSHAGKGNRVIARRTASGIM